MKSNISVGPPIHLVRYDRDTFRLQHWLELRLGDPYLLHMRRSWEQSLKQAFAQMPDPQWQECSSEGHLWHRFQPKESRSG
jgi:putative proteasome-type protease